MSSMSVSYTHLRAALKLRTMEKLSAVGTLSSMAAHELKQPLTVVNNYAGSLRRRLMRSEVPRDVLIEALTEKMCIRDS